MNATIEQENREKRGWKPLTVRFREETLSELQELAEKRDCPQSFLIRQAVEQLIRRNK